MAPQFANTEHEQCLHPERWAIIQAKLEAISDKVSAIAQNVEDMHNRTFVDNGKPCHQTRLQSLETKVHAMIWCIAVTATAVVGELIHSIFTWLRPK